MQMVSNQKLQYERSLTDQAPDDIKVGRCSKLNEYMKLMSTNGQGHSLTLVQISQIQYF